MIKLKLYINNRLVKVQNTTLETWNEDQKLMKKAHSIEIEFSMRWHIILVLPSKLNNKRKIKDYETAD